MVKSPLFGLTLTLVTFYFLNVLYQRKGWFVLNPVFTSILIIILILKTLHVSYEDYNRGGKVISFFLDPAVVAIAVPLYRGRKTIKENKGAIFFGVITGSVLGVASACGLAWILGAPKEIILTLAPKSVTTPIAIRIAEKIGGIPPLTACVVIVTGILGAIMGPILLDLLRIKDPLCRGIGMGVASHGIGTARAFEEGELTGAVSGLCIGLAGVATAFMIPPFMLIVGLGR